MSTRSSEEDDIATLTNDLDLPQMFSLVQLDACLPQVQKTHECLLFSEKLYVVTLLLMFHKTGLKDKKTEHEAKKDVPTVYLSSAAGWRPWPDLCIAPCNGSANMRLQCRWRGGGHTVGGKWGERPVSKQSVYASKSKILIYCGVSVTGCKAKKKHLIDCLAPPFTSPPPSLTPSPRERGHCHQWASLWLQQSVMWVWSSQSWTCSGSWVNRNVIHLHMSIG